MPLSGSRQSSSLTQSATSSPAAPSRSPDPASSKQSCHSPCARPEHPSPAQYSASSPTASSTSGCHSSRQPSLSSAHQTTSTHRESGAHRLKRRESGCRPEPARLLVRDQDAQRLMPSDGGGDVT